MTDTFKKLAQTVIGTIPGVVYTPGCGVCAAIIHRTIIANYTCGSVCVKLWQGGSADVNTILPWIPIPAWARGEDNDILCLGVADKIVAQAGTASAATITLEGVEVT